MILTDSTAAKVGSSNVSAIASSTASFRHFLCYVSTTISTAISGLTGLVKNGTGALTLSGVCDYTGPTQINAGQLAISSASTLNGVISGAGSLAKTSTTALTLGGSNTYSGGTLCAPTSTSGTISFTQNNAFGTGLFTSAGPSQIICNATCTLTNNFQINLGNSLQFRVASGAITLTVSGSVAGSGTINKTSNGILILSGTLTYTGSTTITAGTLRATQTNAASTATANFTVQGSALAVSFNVPPTIGMTFRFFQGTTVNTYATVTLTGAPGRTATYNSANSTLTIA